MGLVVLGVLGWMKDVGENETMSGLTVLSQSMVKRIKGLGLRGERCWNLGYVVYDYRILIIVSFIRLDLKY